MESSLQGCLEDFPPLLCADTWAVYIFHIFFNCFFWEAIFLQPWTKDKPVRACCCESRGQPGICLKACGAPVLPVLFHEWKEAEGGRGEAAGLASPGTASWRFSQLALGKLIQPDPIQLWWRP